MENLFQLEHSDAVTESIEEVFKNVCCSCIEASDVDPSDQPNSSVVIAVISIVGDVNWSIFIGLPKETAETMAEKFCGFDIPFESEDMGDVVGELSNILAGTCKLILDKRNVQVEISLPSVIRANSMEILVQRESKGQKVYFNGCVGNFWAGIVSGKSTGFLA